MSAPKHAPGPYDIDAPEEVVAGYEIQVRDWHGAITATAYGMDEATCVANARLIASAPDLLEALVEARDVIDSKIGLTVAILDQIRAAIARAEGGEG